MTNVNIKITHAELSDHMRDYVDKKMKGLMKFMHSEDKIHLEIAADTKYATGPKYRADISILPKSEIYAEAKGDTLQEAIDLCIPKVKAQLVKRKEKAITKRTRR